MGYVSEADLVPLYANANPGNVASSAVLTTAVQATVQAVNENYELAQATNDGFSTHKFQPVLDHADGSVTATKIRDGNVTTPKIAEAGVTTSKIAPGAVTGSRIQPGAVSSQQLDPALLQNYGDIAVQAKFQRVDSELNQISVNITKYKTGSNSWNDAFEMAYAALPEYGGKILIPLTITITRSINTHSLGTKKVLIEGNGKMNNPGTSYNSVIIKQGDFDGVILAHGCSMSNIAIGRDKSFADTSDGIWVAGITCSLNNVQVNDQGGNGIRVGSKNIDESSVRYNCNIGRFINIGSYNNEGWGVVVRDDFSTEINTSDANALMFLSPDIRANKLGGMLFEKCMDNQVYSADCEVNEGEAGIKIGEETSGISIYSAYTENHQADHDILLSEGSQSNIVIGYRSGRVNDRITDLGSGNFVLGKLGTKFAGYYLKNLFNMQGIRISDETVSGYYEMVENPETRFLDVKFGGHNSDSVAHFKHVNGTNRVGVRADFIDIKDRINSVRLKPGLTVASSTVPANSSVTINVLATGINANNIVVANPFDVLPSGISFYAFCVTTNIVRLTLVNSTSSSVVVPELGWRFVGFDMTALT